MYYAIINDIVHCYNTGTKYQVSFYEETPCTVTKKCYLKIDETVQEVCRDNGWIGDIDLIKNNDLWYKPITKDYTCGTQCCKITYNILCLSQTTDPYGRYWQVTSIDKTVSSGCTGNSGTDCLNGNPEECKSSCGN